MKKYYGLEYLRVVACIGIMAMHICANNSYEISGFIYERIIPSFTDFVFLFMSISAFGMCCGYFEKTISGQINWSDFYKKRYYKILPFFAFLIIIDLVLNFSLPALYEGLTEITLLHGFIPNTFSVIGVGWFLGVVFIFYLIFPFFCVLIQNKLNAWYSFAIAIALNVFCCIYFDLERTNFIYSLCFFLAGGLVYSYKDKIEAIKCYFSLPAVVITISLYYLIGGNTLTQLLVTTTLLVFSISCKIKECKIISFFSDISMEFYLSHMVIFRAIELFHINTLFGNGWSQYIITFLLVLFGTVFFSYSFQKLFHKLQLYLHNR